MATAPAVEAAPRILIVEDDDISRRLLSATLGRLGYDVVETTNGEGALAQFDTESPPSLVVLDWMMPGMDGLELCRRIRALPDRDYTYLVFLTARGQQQDIVEGLNAGADDYLVKPFDPHELESRLQVGQRILGLQRALKKRLVELQEATVHVKQLQGLLPICMHCKNIRDDEDTWHQLEAYIEEQTDAAFTHTLCQDCLEKYYPEQAERQRLKHDG